MGKWHPRITQYADNLRRKTALRLIRTSLVEKTKLPLDTLILITVTNNAGVIFLPS